MKRVVLAFAVVASACAFAAPSHRVAGSGMGGNGMYATDAYPGFDGLDDLPKPEKKEKSWFLGVSRDTPAEQLEYAKEQFAAGSIRSARRACDALVREWPSSDAAPAAQLLLADVLEKDGEYQDAFDELLYLLDFYSSDVHYAEIAERMFTFANVLVKTRRTFWGVSFRSLRILRQNYELLVRHAPGADFVPQSLMAIARLRELDDQYEEAAEVYGGVINRFSGTAEAHDALYLGAAARMWVTRRLAYNRPRCLDTMGYLKLALKISPDHEHAEEMRTWLSELTDYVAKEAYAQAKFYDSKQRTPHAAVAAWENFLKEYPESSHADEIRARVTEIKSKLAPAPDAAKEN